MASNNNEPNGPETPTDLVSMLLNWKPPSSTPNEPIWENQGEPWVFYDQPEDPGTVWNVQEPETGHCDVVSQLWSMPFLAEEVVKELQSKRAGQPEDSVTYRGVTLKCDPPGSQLDLLTKALSEDRAPIEHKAPSEHEAQSEDNASSKRRTMPQCSFCKRGSLGRVRHRLKDSEGRILCPVLKKVICGLCGATGENAHTPKFCPIGRVHQIPLEDPTTEEATTEEARQPQ